MKHKKTQNNKSFPRENFVADKRCAVPWVGAKLKPCTGVVLKDTWTSMRDVREKTIGGEHIACILASRHMPNVEATGGVR